MTMTAERARALMAEEAAAHGEPPPVHDFRPPPAAAAPQLPFAPKVLRFEGASTSTDRSAIVVATAVKGEPV